jgi:hypothetical protein
MKLTFLFLLIPFVSFAQDIPLHANTITIKGVSREQVKKSLVQAGYRIPDRDSSTIVTLQKTYEKLNWGNLILYVTMKDPQTAILTGAANLPPNGPMTDPYSKKFIPAENTSNHENPWMAFQLMVEFAKSLPGQVSYSKE